MSSRASAAITSTPSLCFSACSSSSRLDLIPATLFTAYVSCLVFFFLNDTPPPEISPLPLHAALPILEAGTPRRVRHLAGQARGRPETRRRPCGDSFGTKPESDDGEQDRCCQPGGKRCLSHAQRVNQIGRAHV